MDRLLHRYHGEHPLHFKCEEEDGGREREVGSSVLECSEGTAAAVQRTSVTRVACKGGGCATKGAGKGLEQHRPLPLGTA